MDLLLILGLILLNGVLCLAELSVLSARKVRLENMVRKGDMKAARALALAADPDRFLSTIQIGITMIGILLGAVGDAAFTAPVSRFFSMIPGLATFAPEAAFLSVVLLVTYVSIVLGELVPKRIALARAEACARLLARPMSWFSTATSPLVRLLSASTRVVLWPVAGHLKGGEGVSEDEIRSLIEKGTESGIFHHTEHDLVKRVFSLGDQEVRELMLPRPDIEWLEKSGGAAAILELVRDQVPTQQHLPICDGDLDHVVGVVRVVDVLRRLAKGESPDIESIMTTPLFVSESLPAVRLLEKFKHHQAACAMVVDEFGGTEGLVEFSDLREALLGSVQLPGLEEEQMAVRRDDGSWLLSGSCPAAELRQILSLSELPGEDAGAYSTLAGFLLARLGHIPKLGEKFSWDHFTLEVLDLDGRRIDKVLLTITHAAPA